MFIKRNRLPEIPEYETLAAYHLKAVYDAVDGLEEAANLAQSAANADHAIAAFYADNARDKSVKSLSYLGSADSIKEALGG